MHVSRFIAAAALLIALTAGALAQAPIAPNGVYNITASTATSFAPLAAGASITSAPIPLHGTTERVLSWNLVAASGTPSLIIQVEQVNSGSDTYGRWSVAPFSGATRNTSVTITTTAGGDSLGLATSGLIRFTLTNGASQTVTPTLRLYAR